MGGLNSYKVFNDGRRVMIVGYRAATKLQHFRDTTSGPARLANFSFNISQSKTIDGFF